MTARKPSPEVQEKLVRAAHRAISACNVEGADPDTALAEAASQEKLAAGWLPLLVQAYNHGQAAAEDVNRGFFDTFPVARVEGVRQKIYRQKEADDAVSEEYLRGPRKSSSPCPRVCFEVRLSAPPPRAEKKAAADVSGARLEATRAAFRFEQALTELVDYFRRASARDSFDKVAAVCGYLWGDKARLVLEAVREEAGLSKAASDAAVPMESVDREKPPYSLVQKAVESAEEAVAKYAVFLRLEREAVNFGRASKISPGASQMRSLCAGIAAADGSEARLEKKADLSSGLIGGLTASIFDSLMNPGKADTATVLEDIYEPGHEREIRKIELQAALHDMLRNDPVLSEFDPDDVLEAYNELAQTAPQAASQPGVIRDFLRKRMIAGHLEPFDVNTLLGIEEGIRKGVGATTHPSMMLHALRDKPKAK